ncbi:MAG TPA: hypothetical protein VGA22_04455 [Gemmatimonadales bacterium]|jgi:hypothetical protein
MTTPARRRCGASLLGIWLLAATAAPLAHAETEVLTAGAGLESGHSDSCAVLHVEGRCLKVTSVFAGIDLAPTSTLGNGGEGVARPAKPAATYPRAHVDPHPSRAPPIR